MISPYWPYIWYDDVEMWRCGDFDFYDEVSHGRWVVHLLVQKVIFYGHFGTGNHWLLTYVFYIVWSYGLAEQMQGLRWLMGMLTCLLVCVVLWWCGAVDRWCKYYVSQYDYPCEASGSCNENNIFVSDLFWIMYKSMRAFEIRSCTALECMKMIITNMYLHDFAEDIH